MSVELDEACASAVELARDAARAQAGVLVVGEHREVRAEDVRVATHFFACDHPGYPGWRWAVTVARASRAKAVTIDEVCLVPDDGALLAPAWVPWADRIAAGDVAPGVLMASQPEDPRLEPGFTGGEQDASDDPAEWSQTRAVVGELGLGRERVLSVAGRDEAAERWLDGPGGPDNEMTRLAPAECVTCGYFVRLSGGLGRTFGVCANEYSPQDGTVVSIDHGCGAHSDVLEPKQTGAAPVPIWDTISLDQGLFE